MLFPFLLLLPLTFAAQAEQRNDSCAGACGTARAMEGTLLAPGHAERHGDTMALTSAQGRKFVFTDRKNACQAGDQANCAIFALAYSLPDAFVVQRFGYEGSDIYLIDGASGRRTKLSGMPIFSRDNSEFLITEFSSEGDNNLEIWRREKDGVVLEWAHPFKAVYREDASLKQIYETLVRQWDKDRITLAFSEPGTDRHWTGSLKRDAAGWHLSAKSP
jgi:hypothetical protein